MAPSDGGKHGGSHRCTAGTDNGTPAGPDGPEPGAFNAAKAGGAGADYLAGGRWRERERDCATALHMAQDRQHVAQALAGGGCRSEHGGAFERCASLRSAG